MKRERRFEREEIARTERRSKEKEKNKVLVSIREARGKEASK